MWLRLAYLTLPRAFKPRCVDGKWLKNDISGRYKAVLQKQFYINGVPWIYEKPNTQGKNPRHKKPKGHRNVIYRKERIEKIKQSLLKSAEEETKFRQERLNKRPLKGLDRLVQQTLPAWLVTRKLELLPGQLRRKEDDDEKEMKRFLKDEGFDDL